MVNTEKVPVIDLFAGPGGLSEGFASLTDKYGQRIFNICLSIEKDEAAAKTLRLRSFCRQFPPGELPDAYYEYVRKPVSVNLARECSAAWLAAQEDAWRFELGADDDAKLDQAIQKRTAGHGAWVLIGGPPCQAYSIIGRVRMRGADPKAFEKDHRHFLYRQYLRILAKHQPPIFVMENVKGILSSTVGGEDIFSRIKKDLSDPVVSIGIRGVGRITYRIYSLNPPSNEQSIPEDFVVRAEQHGIPQARHRVILVGLRSDLFDGMVPEPLSPSPAPKLQDVVFDLPPLRSGISKSSNVSLEAWRGVITGFAKSKKLSAAIKHDLPTVFATIKKVAEAISSAVLDTGGEYIPWQKYPLRCRDWYVDPRLGGVLNHSARLHMPEDLHRYLFAACYAKEIGETPKLKDFPQFLLPLHRNVWDGRDGKMFADRFRVQVANRPSTTVTSHICKDGHYFIHPDPTQCRSLTVREAARLQTFPDNYFFEGSRTMQYHQVGNAVPPLLAREIAKSVLNLLIRLGLTSSQWID